MKTTERTEEIRQSLLDANSGCILLLVGVPGSFMCLIAAFFLFIGFSQMYKQERLLKEAVPIEATVIASSSARSTSTTGTGNSRSTSTIYYPKIQYTYEVDAAQHVGDQVWPSPKSFKEQREAAQIASKFTPGEVVTAFVDPNNAATAFLLAQWTAGPYLGVAIAPPVIAFVVAIGVLVAGYRNLFRAAVAVIGSVTLSACTGSIAATHYFMNFEPVAMGPAIAVISVAGLVSLAPVAALLKAKSLRAVLLRRD